MQRPTWRAQIRGGRLTLDEPVDLPDGDVELGIIERQDVSCD
ncbi:hypothetical protein [Chondromyces apiculatus]|uniref:Uncharacterized protein n=1 Tax=Chondromyces apiculatus DSM 436 TaxID=1192034 RepID=A0A017TC05_9BACT|nr:hypothetical protein [Chondromyces apiculatus]EYF06442.1 Hypothetical protein CAP_1972 [Chondromyces apiculatus DSM 436]